MTYTNPQALGDYNDNAHWQAVELDEAFGADIERRTDAIAHAPTDEQLCDALAAVGSGKADNARLMAAYAKGQTAFLAEVWEQIQTSFAEQAELAIIGESHEVLRDWD